MPSPLLLYVRPYMARRHSSTAHEKSENFLRQFRSKTNSEFFEVSASQLLAIWNHYDTDGNGYLEDDELDRFLIEFVSSACQSNVGVEVVSPTMLEEVKQDFLDAYDENDDGRIDIKELSELLPIDENFLLLFQLENQLSSSVDFMKIWKAYDTDQSGCIEGQELEHFLDDLLMKAHPDKTLPKETLKEYADAILNIFDDNKDGKLQLSEMARLLPIKDNVLKETISRTLFESSEPVSYFQIEAVFAAYDKDGNGSIESDELAGFVRDLLTLMKPDCTVEEVEKFQRLLLKSCDLDGDGTICKEELTVMLLGLQKCRKRSA